MEIGGWEVAAVAAKWLMLIAAAGAIGGGLVLSLARRFQLTAAELAALQRHLQRCALTGLLATPLWFLLLVGSVNRSGLGGMFDTLVGGILLQSGQGTVLQMRLLGFAVLTAFTLRPVFATMPAVALGSVHALVALLLCVSFGVTGHSVELPGAARLVLALHVLTVLLWIGALKPLQLLCKMHDLRRLQELMHGFGTLALGMILALLLSGVYLATQLLQAPAELLTTPYGRVLLLKMFGVYGLLMFAAMNKLLLVPRLVTAGSATGLEKSIRMEWIVGLLVLAVTSWLTSVVGPAGM